MHKSLKSFIGWVMLSLLLTFNSLSAAQPSYHDILAHVDQTATAHGMPPAIVKAVIKNESGWRVNARSPKNAMGLMQLIPETAARFGVSNAYDPLQNINGGVAYLAWLNRRFNGDWQKTLAGYNAGEGAVDKHNGIPPYKETQNYVVKVMRDFREYQKWGNGQPELVNPIASRTKAPSAARIDKSIQFAVNNERGAPQWWEANVSATTVKWTPPTDYYR
jgi:Soluble lytic murein transglycosylase and related regulatory proteins (some contain LysM/invasin domains)